MIGICSSFREAAAGAGAVAFFVLQIALGIAQLFAFIEGVALYFGYGWLGSAIVFVVAAMIPFGAIATTILAMYGAIEGWGWPWWQAALLCMPYFIISVGVLLFGNVVDAIDRNRWRSQRH